MLSFDIRSLEAQAANVDEQLSADDPVWEEGDPKPDSAVQVTGRLSAASTGRPDGGASGQPLVDPLSERELDVLRLLASDLDGPDIARELTVSLNTLRTHTKRIYAKLGVTSRRAAVQRAQALHLLPGRR